MGVNRKLEELPLPRKRWGMEKGAAPAENSCSCTVNDSPTAGASGIKLDLRFCVRSLDFAV